MEKTKTCNPQMECAIYLNYEEPKHVYPASFEADNASSVAKDKMSGSKWVGRKMEKLEGCVLTELTPGALGGNVPRSVALAWLKVDRFLHSWNELLCCRVRFGVPLTEALKGDALPIPLVVSLRIIKCIRKEWWKTPLNY